MTNWTTYSLQMYHFGLGHKLSLNRSARFTHYLLNWISMVHIQFRNA